MTFTRGKIVWVRYPFSDNPGKYKYRPALIICSEEVHEVDNDVILLPITSSLHNDYFSYQLHEEFLKKGALPKNSEVCCHKPATVRTSLIVGEMNEVTSDALESIKRKVKVAMALGPQSVDITS